MLTRIIRAIAVVYTAYLAVCLLILLPAMNILAPRLVEQATGRTLASELILFNPFTLALELRGTALNARRAGEPPLLAFDRLRANLSTSTLWTPGITLDELLLEGLTVDIRQRGDGKFNFSDLIPEDSGADEVDTSASLPAFTVGRTVFQADHLDFADESRSPAYETHLDNVAFTIRGMSTVRDAGSPYRFSVVTEHGGRLDWEGELSLATRQSHGKIRLTDVDLRPVYRYLEPQLAFALDSAQLDVDGSYRAHWQANPGLELTDGSVVLRDLQLHPRDAASLPDTSVALGAIRVTGITASSTAHRLDVAGIDIHGLAVSGFSEGDTHSLLPMFMAAGDETGSSDSAGGNDAAEPPQDWQFTLTRLTTDDTRLRWRSTYTTPEHIALDPVRLELRNLAWPAQGDSNIDLSLRANDRSDMTVSGLLDIGTGNGRLDYRLTDQPLAWFNPLVAEVLRATIDEGALDIAGSTRLEAYVPATLDLDSTIENFALRIFGRDASALAWTSLTIPDVRINLPQQSAAIGTIALDGYRGSLHILPDGRVNALMALPEPANSDSQDGVADNPGASATGAAAAPDGNAPDWRMQGDGLQLTDARIDFEDESLPIPFRTLIGQLEGNIGAIDSAQPDRPTDIGLTGSVDGYAPVTIEGNVAPFAESTALALTLRFKGVDIANLTPYSGTYAGYAIDSGTLNLDLAYSLEGDRLQGDNHAVISQMVLGEPVDSEQAIDLPLKLALALLTDARGIIDLEVPIEGNVDNPEFSLGKIIGRTLRNILTKTVTAPFRFLASLVGSDDDLQTMAFVAGSDTFDSATQAKLDSLASALAQRPALNVLVRGSMNPQEDVRALRVQALEQELLATGALTTDALAARGAAWEAALAAHYAAVMTADGDGASDGNSDDNPEAELPSTRAMRETLLERIEIPRSTLDALVRTRAAAVKRQLVNAGGIAADRVTISGRAEDAQLAGAVLDVSS